MQPTYLPWLGYFDLVDQSDLFVLLDDVQFEKQSWQQRNRIKTSRGPQWLTVPVYQRSGQQIREGQINQSVPWRTKHLKSLAQNYSRTEGWEACAELLTGIYEQQWEHLVDLNISAIRSLGEHMGIQTPLSRSSGMGTTSGRLRRLIQICHNVGARAYLSPRGSASYLGDGKQFADEGIRLEYHAYSHPVYTQQYGAFLSHMSVVDLLCNEGAKTLEIVRSGRAEITHEGQVDG